MAYDTNSKPDLCVVARVSHSDTRTRVELANTSAFELPPFLYVNPGETLEVEFRLGVVARVKKIVSADLNPETDTPTVAVFPAYSRLEDVPLNPHSLRITFRERRGPRDAKSIKLLEQFHYRGNGLNKIVGRRTVLVAEAEGIGIIGYGVLSATVLACRPRFKLFDVNLKKQMGSKLINRLARIPRVVVHPEFRGLGLGSRIARHLTEYAKNHWDIKGYKPVLIEVIASMTEYHKFFEMAGFVSCGTTEGKSTIFKPFYGQGGWENRENSEDYAFFAPLGPKPYLVFPLTPATAQLVTNTTATAITPTHSTPSSARQILEFADVTVSYRTRPRISERTSRVKTVFGIDQLQMTSPTLRRFNLIVHDGEVVLVTGASGSGKSTLLKLLTQNAATSKRTLNIHGRISKPTGQSISMLANDWDPERPLVDQLGESLEQSIALLNSVGLAEAHLYLKTPNQISEGQRYRFAIARLCDSRRPIWIADEFTSSLDPITAALVAKGLRKQAVKRRATVIVAAPHVSHFVDSFLPTKIVRLSWGGTYELASVQIYMYKASKSSFFVRVRNTGSVPLTNIRVFLDDIQCSGTPIGTIDEIRPFRKNRLEVSYDQLLTSRAEFLVVTCDQKVGDVLFLERTKGFGRRSDRAGFMADL